MQTFSCYNCKSEAKLCDRCNPKYVRVTQGPDWHMYAIVISNNVQDLTGRGEEYLVDHEQRVIARFINGDLMADYTPIGNGEITKIS